MKQKRSCFIPYAVYESAMARFSRERKRSNAALVMSAFCSATVVAIALIINNAAWQKHELNILGK